MSIRAARSKFSIPNGLKIFITPLDHDCEEKFVYAENGEIFGKDDLAEKTIKVLNIGNTNPVLKNMRKNAIEGFYFEDITKEDAKKIIENISEKNEKHEFVPFCGVIVNFLKNNLSIE